MCQIGLIILSTPISNITLYKGMYYLGLPIRLCRGLSLINYSLAARLSPIQRLIYSLSTLILHLKSICEAYTFGANSVRSPQERFSTLKVP